VANKPVSVVDEDPLGKFPADQRRVSHVVGPVAITHLAGIKPIGTRAQKEIRAWVVQHSPGPRWLSRLSGMGSWNIPQIDGCLMLWAGLPTARDDWELYLKWQLRDATPPAGAERLALFGGSESLSANYEAWRWGAVAGVYLWAVRNGDKELVSLARRWFIVAATLGTFVSTSRFPNGEYGRNKRGERLDTSRWMSPVSNRSNLAHAYHPVGVLLDILLQRDPSMRRPGEWFVDLVRVANLETPILSREHINALEAYFAAPTQPETADTVCAFLGAAGVYGTFRVIWWRDCRVVYLDQRRNPNTPAIMFEVLSLVNGDLYLGYPWPGGRAFKASGQIPTIWDRDKGEISAVSQYGLAFKTVPKTRPEMIIVIDDRGARVEERAA
jgi:hypothetical protein